MELPLSFSLFFMLIIFHSLIQFHKPAQADEDKYQKCKNSFKCGNLDNLGYPFYDEVNRPEYCGYPGFKLDCSNDMADMYMNSTQKLYLLEYRNTSHSISVAREDYWQSLCPEEVVDTSINFTRFSYTNLDGGVTLCYVVMAKIKLPQYQFRCATSFGFFKTLPDVCNQADGVAHKNIFVPVYQTAAASIINDTSLLEALRSGFELKWSAENDLCDTCSRSGGACGYDLNLKNFTCYSADEMHGEPHGSKSNGNNTVVPKSQKSGSGQTLAKSRIVIIASTSVIGTGMLIILVIYFKRRYLKHSQVVKATRPKTKQEVKAFLRDYGISGPKRYSHTDLKRITNSFKDKLGEGGYGTVYRGKLNNGHQVAVKVLKKSQGDPVDFINEIASIGKTNHKNIVSLLGFCYEGNKQALVYDFMPNGSLEKFIYRGNDHQSLPWEQLFQIVVGIATGLEYLHQGCNTRILHFDIKPHNILLDENFCPKISDFGLAKSCPQTDSIISMSGARGTVGYIAPEVFFNSLGGVSQKSDVYSYGMFVLEMVGCTKKSGATVECSGEEYFPHWIYEQLERETNHDHQEILIDEEKELWRKMVLVSLWCIQTKPQSRPTMSRVVEMLEGTSESLQVPPIPNLSSLPRPLTHQNSASTHTISIS